jgi:hypothetical protein
MKKTEQYTSSEVQEAIETSSPLVNSEWDQISKRFPIDIEASCKENKVIQRRREVRSGKDLLRLVLAYAICDWPFRLLGAWATGTELAKLSDTAARKQVRKSSKWLTQIVASWLQQRHSRLKGTAVRVKIIDATVINEPGSKGVDWRLHTEFDLRDMKMTGLELTDVHGGETLQRHEPESGTIFLADRAYDRRAGLGLFLQAQAYVVVRTNGHNLPMETAQGQAFNMLTWLKACSSSTPCEIPVWVSTPQGCFELRLIATALPPEAAERARRRTRQNSRKKNHEPSALSQVAAGYVLLVTNLSASLWSASDVLALYRLRWQIETLFKRFKSIWHLDHLRTDDPCLSRAYLLGKLIGALLMEDWMYYALEGVLSDWTDDALRPLSWWRLMRMLKDLLIQTIRGYITLAQWAKVWQHLGRYLRDGPRKRKQQAVWGRQWLDSVDHLMCKLEIERQPNMAQV